jgi:hypothetical protein
MNKKLLYAIIILTLVISLFGIRGRFMVEQSNKNVELAFDYNSFSDMKEEYNNQALTLDDLKEYGVNSIAISPLNIKNLIREGKVVKLEKSEITKRILLSNDEESFWQEFPEHEKSAFLIFKEQNDFYNNLQIYQNELNLEFKEINGKNIVFFPYWKDDYLKIDLGFESSLIKDIKDKGLNVVLRFENNDINDLNYKLLKEMNEDTTVVFSGQEILGFPDNIDKTTELMQEKNNTFGFIEAIIGVQKGEDKLAANLDYDIVRVHSITQDEMNIYSQSKIVNRYMRAIRERNIRFLYLRPIIKENKDFAAAKSINKEYIQSLNNELVSAGYEINRAVPFQQFSNNSIFLIFSALGILVGGILLLIEIFKIREDLIKYILTVIGILGVFLTYFILDITIFRAGLALGSSIVFPSLAIITQLLKRNSKKSILNYLKAALITIAGAGFVVTALADISYLTKINQFRGVKLAFLMPLLIVAFYYFMEYIVREKNTTIKQKFNEILEINLKVKHLLILAIVALAGIYYILRTGNFPILDIPAIEEKFRVLLEEILYVRPRFKEFLIGHPVFIVALYYFKNIKNNYSVFFLSLLAVIGQLNIINSFAHIYTPLLISLLRTVHGLWIGLLLGLAAVLVIRYLINLTQDQRVN